MHRALPGEGWKEGTLKERSVKKQKISMSEGLKKSEGLKDCDGQVKSQNCFDASVNPGTLSDLP